MPLNWFNKIGKVEIKKFIIWLLWDFSGLRFIASKVRPPLVGGGRKPATFLLWLIGIYIALFGVASQRYENRVDIIENRANAIFAQLSTPVFKKALRRVPSVQNMACPLKPSLFNPWSIFRSLVFESQYTAMVNLLTDTVADWNESLEGLDLSKVQLAGADLTRAKLSQSILVWADLREAVLFEADLRGAHLQRADMRGSFLRKADLNRTLLQEVQLSGADLRQADLSKTDCWEAELSQTDLSEADLSEAKLQFAIIRGSNFKGAKLFQTDLSFSDLRGAVNLTAEQLAEAKTLFGAKINPRLEEEIRNINPQLLDDLPEVPKPEDDSSSTN